jgi:predicted  nucleic acid-binding Zn ribbon protein
MFTAKISFQKEGRNAEATTDSAHDLLSCWYKNGQIVKNSWAFADRDVAVDVYVTIPEPTSLEPLHGNRYVAQALEDLVARGHQVPSVTVLGVDPCFSAVCSCKSTSSLLLYTHYMTEAPPVRCLVCFQPVPLYRLPYVHDEEHLLLLQWAADYRACDTLQMHCTTGERFGEDQLYRHDSSLNKNGRGLGEKLEALAGCPVYYFLHKTRSRGKKRELERRCPSCGGNWRLDARLHIFNFQCEPCRLLSAIAADAS